MTELEAMNMLLRLIGLRPVNSVESAHPDAIDARVALTRVATEIQKKGWWFNVDYNVTLQPQPNGTIDIATDVAKVVPHSPQYVVRGTKLWDKWNQTQNIGCDVEVQRIEYTLPWEQLPGSLQSYISYIAAQQFIREKIEDENKAQSLNGDIARTMVDAKREDLEQGQYNKFNNARVLRARGGVRPYQRGAGRFYGTPDR